MTKEAKKHMIYWAAWVLCMGAVLLAHFSWVACGILVVLAIVSLYRNVLSKENVAKYIFLRVRYYIILSTIFFVCVTIIEYGNGFDLVYIENNLDGILESTYMNITGYWKENKVLVSTVVIVSLVLVCVRKKGEAYPFLHTVLTYQFSIVFYSLLGAAQFRNTALCLAYLIYAFVFLSGDLVREVYDKWESLGEKAGKRCFDICSLLLWVCAVFNPQLAIRCRRFDLHTVIDVLGHGSVFVFLFVVSLVVCIGIMCIETSRTKGYAQEKMLLLTGVSILPVVFVCAGSPVPYGWGILLGTVFYVLLAVTRSIPQVTDECTIVEYLPIPCVAISAIFLLIEAQQGRMEVATIFWVSTWLLALALRRIVKREETKRYTAGLSLGIGWLYGNTLARLWLLHRHTSACILMTVVTILFLGVVYLIHYNPGIYEKNALVRRGQFLLPLLYVGIAWSVVAQGGCDIDLIIEEGYIQVEIETEGDHAAMEYCWLADMTEVADDILHEEKTEYIRLSPSQKIPVQDGLLKIIVEDENGVQTVKKQWFSGGE